MVQGATTAELAARDAAADLGKLVLRLSVGLLVLLHGIGKIRGGPGFILDLVDKAGLPGPLGYLVHVGEVGQLFQLAPQGGWALERQGLYLSVPIAIALLGAGRYSMGGRAARRN